MIEAPHRDPSPKRSLDNPTTLSEVVLMSVSPQAVCLEGRKREKKTKFRENTKEETEKLTSSIEQLSYYSPSKVSVLDLNWSIALFDWKGESDGRGCDGEDDGRDLNHC